MMAPVNAVELTLVAVNAVAARARAAATVAVRVGAVLLSIPSPLAPSNPTSPPIPGMPLCDTWHAPTLP